MARAEENEAVGLVTTAIRDRIGVLTRRGTLRDLVEIAWDQLRNIFGKMALVVFGIAPQSLGDVAQIPLAKIELTGLGVLAAGLYQKKYNASEAQR
jgi:hypothetical protein